MGEPGNLEDQPYPLRRYFHRRIVPLLVAFVMALIGLTVLGARQATEAIYLDLAQRRADTIAHSISAAVATDWEELMAGRFGRARHPNLSEALHKAFAAEVDAQKLIRLKVYDLDRRAIYDSVTEAVGKVEAGDALRRAIGLARPSAVARTEPDGTAVYELYVPLLDAQGRVQAVFELYEPIDRLDGILARATAMPLLLPGILMVILMVTLWRLVGRAQADIDARTSAMTTLRRRIETFMSAGATEAARRTGPGGAIESRRLTLSLLYSDVRSFTSFAEASGPEEAVDFLNRLMTIQVRAVHDHGGDVDKLIGDAMLALFQGRDGNGRAVAAAQEILKATHEARLARPVGIGLFTGEVISGAVGPAERRDYTVIGDSVNISARLCAAAAGGELVADAASIAGIQGFGPSELIAVRGRNLPISIRRWRRSDPAPL